MGNHKTSTPDNIISLLNSSRTATENDHPPFYKIPLNLSDNEIIGLFKVCFFNKFFFEPETLQAHVTLFVKYNSATDCGFDFWFVVESSVSRKDYRGTIYGSEDILIAAGNEDKGSRLIPDNWEQNFSIPIKAVFSYLWHIGFFHPLETRPLPNPSLTSNSWTQIYYTDNRSTGR